MKRWALLSDKYQTLYYTGDFYSLALFKTKKEALRFCFFSDGEKFATPVRVEITVIEKEKK